MKNIDKDENIIESVNDNIMFQLSKEILIKEVKEFVFPEEYDKMYLYRNIIYFTGWANKNHNMILYSSEHYDYYYKKKNITRKS